jgi:hypothetical protein
MFFFYQEISANLQLINGYDTDKTSIVYPKFQLCSVPPALNIQTFDPTQKLRYPNSDLQLLLFKHFLNTVKTVPKGGF